MGKILTLTLVGVLLPLHPTFGTPIDAPTSVAELLAGVEQRVVSIQIERREGTDLPAARIGEVLGGGEARSYFRRPDGPVTGFIIDGGGHILTSFYNVVGELESLSVTFASGETSSAEVLAVSAQDDVALLRAKQLPGDAQEPTSFEPWRDSKGLGAGQIVFAVGRSPDPRSTTVTRGIVSALGRNAGRAFQTDAKLNYGNVGGPLIDLEGRLVGIACFVGHHQPQWGINSGVGFGTTVKTLRRILPRLREGKNIKPPMLGVISIGKEVPEGSHVGRVVEGGAAAKAGVIADDILLEINGEAVRDFYHLKALVLAHEVGDVVQVKVKRQEKILELEIALGEKP